MCSVFALGHMCLIVVVVSCHMGGHTMMAGRLAGRSGWAAAEEEARGRRFQNSGRKKPNLKAKRQDVPKPYIRERAKSLPVKISCLVGLGVLREQRAQSRG